MKRAKKRSFALNIKGKKGRGENKTKKYVIILIISLLVIIFASLAAFLIGGMFNSESDMWDVENGIMAPVDKVSGKVNVLILGVDKEGLRTDTMIVASYDATNGTVNMLSIPRDTRMYIGAKYQKINAAHALSQKNGKIKGPAGSIEAVTRLTGIPINYYVEFSFEAFRETIDALGGVNFNVPQRMVYKDPTQGLYIDLYKGEQLLDGDKAEQLVRFRRYPEGDIKRVRVQQEFIRAVIEQKLNLQIVGKIPDIYNAVSKNIKTNLSVGDIIKYANSLLDIDREKIVMYELPGEYSGPQYTASYWLPDMKEIKLLVQNTFGYDSSKATTAKGKSGVEYGGKHTTEKLNPEDVKISEQDKQKAPDKTESSSKKEDSSEDIDEKETTKKSESEEKKDNAAEKEPSKNQETEKNEIILSDEPEEEIEENNIIETDSPKVPAPSQEPVIKEETQVPVEEPEEGTKTSDGFVRPGANKKAE